MSHFERELTRELTRRARRMTDDELAALLLDPETSVLGLRVVQAEVEARAGRRVAS